MKTLIAYFSRRGENYVSGSLKDLKRGNTELLAEMIHAQLADADMFRIETVNAYSASYNTCIQEAKQELNGGARPALAADCDPAAYDTIILGFPNWWSHVPMAVLTWLEAHDFSGKTIVPFCTHEGSGMASTEGDIRKACPTANVLKGTPVFGSSAATATQEAAAIADKAR